jgi:hypothetical protein
MRNLFFVILTVGLLWSCESNENKKHHHEKDSLPEFSYATKEAHDFVNKWILLQNKAPLGLVDQFRNKVLNQTDAKELRKFLEKRKINDSIFGNIEDSIKLMEYHCFDKKQITERVVWVNQKRLRACRSISKEAMWDCLKQDYGLKDYYYLSVPIFSSDGQYAVISVNYMESESKKSHGAGTLFKKLENGNWEEIALLSGWGHFD